jgi:hypothetical protein
MFETGQCVEILDVHGAAGEYLPPVVLLEKDRDGSKGWQRWLVESVAGKKELRWVTPGSRLVLSPSGPPVPDSRFNPKHAPEPPAPPAAKRARLAQHKPILPDPNMVAGLIAADVLADVLSRIEEAIRVQGKQIVEIGRMCRQLQNPPAWWQE